MSVTLHKRVAALEGMAFSSALRRVPDKPASLADSSLLEKWCNFRFYDTWRHGDLSLEERLALAKDDDARAQANPEPTWAPERWQIGKGQWVNRWYAVSAREIEIRILERERRIDALTARALRDNLRAHFLGDAATGPSGERSNAQPLAALPCSIEIDLSARLASALKKCPCREDLSPKEQLALAHEDHRRDFIERRQPQTYPPGAIPPLPGLDAFADKLHEVEVARLERMIREHGAAATQT